MFNCFSVLVSFFSKNSPNKLIFCLIVVDDDVSCFKWNAIKISVVIYPWIVNLSFINICNKRYRSVFEIKVDGDLVYTKCLLKDLLLHRRIQFFLCHFLMLSEIIILIEKIKNSIFCFSCKGREVREFL